MYYSKKRKKKSVLATCKEERCISRGCRNKRERKTNGTFSSHCSKCRSRILRERHPWTYILSYLRKNARARGIAVTLTILEFKEWCLKTRYHELRGNTPESMTIDRIDRREGYHIWNIRPLSHKENSDQGADNTPRDELPEPTDMYASSPEDPF